MVICLSGSGHSRVARSLMQLTKAPHIVILPWLFARTPVRPSSRCGLSSRAWYKSAGILLTPGSSSSFKAGSAINASTSGTRHHQELHARHYQGVLWFQIHSSVRERLCETIFKHLVAIYFGPLLKITILLCLKKAKLCLLPCVKCGRIKSHVFFFAIDMLARICLCLTCCWSCMPQKICT